MINSIKENLTKRVELSEDELKLFCSDLVYKKVKKNKLIHVENSIMQHFFFIEKGLLRMYTTTNKFEEQTFEFCYENTWIVDLKSLQEKTLSQINIETLEDCELYSLHIDDVIRLHHQIPSLEKFSRIHAEERYIEAMIRIQQLYHPNLSSKDRFQSFNIHYPMLRNRISSQHLASFLGVVPETISRLKRELIIQK